MAGVGPGAFVGICVERSFEMVVGLLAILKAGAASIALDPGYPAERLAFMVSDARAEVVLAQVPADRVLREPKFPAELLGNELPVPLKSLENQVLAVAREHEITLTKR